MSDTKCYDRKYTLNSRVFRSVAKLTKKKRRLMLMDVELAINNIFTTTLTLTVTVTVTVI